MYVQEIWRYPVKSMAGELLSSARITAQGVEGDRIVQVYAPNGRVLTSRTRPLILRHRGSLSPEGVPLIDGKPWNSPEIAKDIEAAAGAGAILKLGEPVFDILPLLLATDGMIQATGYDRRRFRPNLVIGGVDGLAEREWEGKTLRIGNVILGLEDLRGRCIMTTFDPDSGEQDLNVLRRIQREFGGVLGLNTYVIQPGAVRIGDPVELLP